jgi:two-component system, LytTR family, response regulator
LRILVVDDEPVARERIQRLLAGADASSSVAIAEDGVAAVESIRESKPDLVFLDVQMPGLDGFEVIDAVGPALMPLTIFVTAYDEHATRAFDAEALDYLVKPYDDARFLASLERARRRIVEGQLSALGARYEAMLSRREQAARGASSAETGDEAAVPSAGRLDRFILRSGTRARLVRADQIDWFAADGMYARVHLPGESHLLRMPMHELEARLDGARFVRVHRSAIVNLDRVRELRELDRGEWAIVLTSGVQVKLSRSRRSRAARRLGQSL